MGVEFRVMSAGLARACDRPTRLSPQKKEKKERADSALSHAGCRRLVVRVLCPAVSSLCV